MMKKLIAIPAVAICLIAFVSCGNTASATETKTKTWYTMFDTVSSVKCYSGDSEEVFGKRAEKVGELLGRYNKLLDIYHCYSGINNLCTVNSKAGDAQPVKVDKDLIEFLLYAREQSTGKLNVMMGSVLNLWHKAGYAVPAVIPSEEDLLEAKKHISMDSLVIDAENCSVMITDAEASINPGAIGKGWAAEKAAQWLREDGADGYVVNLGGNVRLVGTKPDGSGWTVGIKDPQDPDNKLILRLELADKSCVTSGNYEKFYFVDNVKYTHIIDPETLFPPDNFSSVSVITENSALADALSTRLYLMSYEEGLKLAEDKGVECIWVFPDNTVRYTPGIAKLLAD